MYKDLNIEEIALSQIRKVISERMTESSKIPQFTVSIDVNADAILELRSKNKYKPSVTACIIWCCAKALKEKKMLNGFFYDNKIGLASEVNIGVAVAIPSGLIVPVIKDADKKVLDILNEELSILTSKAKSNKLSLDDMHGCTFTISNLGMYGITGFNALLNPPQIAIMSVGGLKEGIRLNNGNIEQYKYFNAAVTADHRALDGASVAEFLQRFKEVCEDGLEVLDGI